jgi:hypothetical protein
MSRQRVTLQFLTLLLLATVSVTGGQTRKPSQSSEAQAKAKIVTITLVRWPYT